MTTNQLMKLVCNHHQSFVAATLMSLCLNVSAVEIADARDTLWSAKPGEVSFEITHVSGGLASDSQLEFGLYDPDDLSMIPIFPNGYALGDMASLSDIGSSPFGFYLENTGTTLGGPYVLYSNSALNPAIPGFTEMAGEDAMAAEDLGGDTWLIEFEDLFLPLTLGTGDLRLTVTNIMPAVVFEPSTVSLVGLAIFGLAATARRRRSLS